MEVQSTPIPEPVLKHIAPRSTNSTQCPPAEHRLGRPSHPSSRSTRRLGPEDQDARSPPRRTHRSRHLDTQPSRHSALPASSAAESYPPRPQSASDTPRRPCAPPKQSLRHHPPQPPRSEHPDDATPASRDNVRRQNRVLMTSRHGQRKRMRIRSPTRKPRHRASASGDRHAHTIKTSVNTQPKA